MFTELVGGALHEHLDTGLARAVRAHEPVRRVTGDRRHAHDRAAPSADHRGRRVLDREERTHQVEIDRRAPARGVGSDDRTTVQRSTRAREQHVELATRFARGRDRALDVGLVSDVAHHVVRGRAGGRNRTYLRDRLGEPGLGAPGDRHVRAVGGEPERTPEPDPGTAPGDERGHPLHAGHRAASGSVDDGDGLLGTDPDGFLALGAKFVGRLILQHVQEVVLAHLEHFGRGCHAQGIALALVEVDDNPEAHVYLPMRLTGGTVAHDPHRLPGARLAYGVTDRIIEAPARRAAC